jgi:membrane-bound inhibitor of C-type lysozyme
MKLLPLSLIALGLLGCSTVAKPDRFTFACASGSSFTVSYDGKGAAMVEAGGKSYTLPSALSGSGARYSDGSVEFWEHQGKATLTGAVGGPYEACPLK